MERHRDGTLEKSNVGSTNYENVPVDRMERHRDGTLEKSNVDSTNYENVPVDRMERHRDGTLEKSNVGSINYENVPVDRNAPIVDRQNSPGQSLPEEQPAANGQRANRNQGAVIEKRGIGDETKPSEKSDDINIDPAKMSAGERILSSMQSVSETSLKFSTETIAQIGSEIVNRILISNAALDAKQEVRVQLKNDVLPGTEIFIAKDGPKLNVQFVTTVSESAFFLMGRQGELRQHLMDNLKEINSIEINVSEDARARDARGDGRSKNQRQYENPGEDE
jgi:type III secretion system needle length determinant